MATTTPIYGFDVPTSTDYVKDGATAIETLGDDVDAMLGVALNSKLHAGLVLIKSQAVTTGVSSVTITSAFSATYDAYKIIFSGIQTSSGVGCTIALSGSTSGYYSSDIASGAYTTASGTLSFNCINNGSFWNANVISSNGTTQASGATIEIQNPFNSTSTTIQSNGSDARTNGSGLRIMTGYHSAATSYTDFVFACGGTTFQGGRISVYGYAKD
jgi:hypothetical protein